MTTLVPTVSPKSRNIIEGEAEDYLRLAFPTHLQKVGALNVIEAFESLQDYFPHLETGVEDLQDGVEGITWPDGRVILSEKTYRGAHKGLGRCRFTVMHEIYHAIKHQSQIRQALVDNGKLMLYRRSDIPAYRDPEWQANTFAAAVLMPQVMVKRVIAEKAPCSYAATLSQVFEVSEEAASIRLKHLAQ